jgi:superfamily II DNA or RNA helicase|tara:strand:+ start:918 stop:2282 length:1365 start_codon:yes stop_codon:yes gene_type:complete
MPLRSYQELAIDQLRGALNQHPRALLVMPTGSGKTVVFSEICRLANAKGRHVLILVHRRELVKQASDKLTKAGVKHGIIAAGFKPSAHPVQVASVQTLARRLLTVPAEPDLLVIDEAHHALAGSWDKILLHFKNARVIGVTATPSRLDGRGLGSHFSTLVSGPSVEQLTKLGFLSPHKVFAPPVIADLRNVKTRAGDYANDQLSQAMDRPTITGDAIGHYRRLADGLPAIAFCCSIAHATSVCEAFNVAGYRAKLVTGKMKMEERDEAISGLADGRTQILCSVDVVSEGTDVPAVSAAILLRPTQSEALYLQQVGRILRPQPNKTAIVLDHVGNTVKHGFVDDVRDWSLNAKPRRKKNNEPAPSVRQCSRCFAAFKPQPVCPCCGFEFPVKPKRQLTQREGELKEMRRLDAIERREKRKQQGRARTLPELLALARKKGYKDSWAYKVFYGRRRS